MQEKIDACARALTAYGVRDGDAESLWVLAMPEARLCICFMRSIKSEQSPICL